MKIRPCKLHIFSTQKKTDQLEKFFKWITNEYFDPGLEYLYRYLSRIKAVAFFLSNIIIS